MRFNLSTTAVATQDVARSASTLIVNAAVYCRNAIALANRDGDPDAFLEATMKHGVVTWLDGKYRGDVPRQVPKEIQNIGAEKADEIISEMVAEELISGEVRELLLKEFFS